MATKTIEIQGVSIVMRRHHWTRQTSLKVARDGKVTVMMPKWTPYKIGELFAHSHTDWIKQQLDRVDARPDISKLSKPTASQKKQARQLVEQKLGYWNQWYGFKWNKVFIRDQRTRWGSCSSNANLNFNWKIITLPESLQDYIIVHELCHLKQANHSPKFWELVGEALDDPKKLRRRLREINLGIDAEI